MNNVLVQRIDYPDGKWVYYKYDEFGRKTFEFSTYNNNPPPASGVEPSVVTDRCKEIAYTYNDNSSSPYTTVISVPVEVSGVWQSQEVSRATHYVESHWSMDQQSVGGGNGDLTTYTYYYSDSNDSASYQRIQSISNPNGTASYYNYILTNGTFITVESSGEPDDWNQPYSIFNGKQTTTVIDGLGRTLSRVVTNIVDGIATNQLAGDTFVYSPTDLFWRDYYRYDLANRTNQYQYACCGLDSTVDPDGVVTMYSYDLLRRETGRTVLRGTNAVTFTNVLDGLGRSLDSLRIGSSSAVISSERYDSLGRVVAETNALHGATRISYSIVGNQRYVTNTYPDGGTRIEQYYRDGRLQSVSGTAVFPLQYQYGTEQDSNDGVWREYTLEIKPTATGETNEWVKTITDAAGRHFKTFYSGTASDCFAVSYYNNSIPGGQLTNQIDPDGVSTLYAYNEQGERVLTVLDMDRDSQIDYAGEDRITMVTNDVVFNHGMNVQRSQTYVWSTMNSDAATLTSTVESSTDGLHRWQTVWVNGTAVTRETHILYIPSEGLCVTTDIAPDASYTVTTNQYGLARSVTQKNSSGVTIGQTTFGYDAEGRRTSLTDARNGLTVNYFNDADLVSGTKIAPPGQSVQNTTNYFDGVGRIWKTTFADGTSVTNEYELTGLLKKTYGSRTYPVEYTYDYAGRMRTMKTWTNYASNLGSVVTTW
ncbi:MAG: hypothetical protein ACTHKU_01460, partial [Verrucomicrobiota bacterium]